MTDTTISNSAQRPPLSSFAAALPFWMSLAFVPILAFSAWQSGLWLGLAIVFVWFIVPLLDVFSGLNLDNKPTDTKDDRLFWYRAITLVWFPIQFCLIFGALAFVSWSDHLSGVEKIFMMIAVGLSSGTIGINYAHELMHQKPKVERMMADGLLALVLYGHFRSEHLLVHHRYVGTPRDPVTARYNEGFWHYFPRVLIGCFRSAWRAEKQMLARKKLPVTDFSNPFWRYFAVQGAFLLLAFLIGGGFGVLMFIFQAFVAVQQLEMVNYVEHYGLTRKHLGGGKYEHVKPHHSWNAAHKATNYLLINLQRHSDHHYKPDRRFPLLQNYDKEQAPQLPHSYPVMTYFASIPPLWFRMMNKRVKNWRAQYYPEIVDWRAYNKGSNQMPR